MPISEETLASTELVRRRGNVLTGSRDAIFLRNRYQVALDSAYGDFSNAVHHVENVNRRKTVEFYYRALSLKKDIEAHRSERASLYEALNGHLQRETEFESGMWKTTQEGLKVDTFKVEQKFKDSDIDEVRFGSMLDYLKNYPVLSSRPSFADILSKIKDKEGEIRGKEESYNEAVGNFKKELPYFRKGIQWCDSYLISFNKVLEDGSERILSCRYVKSIWFKLLSEDRKMEVLLDTLYFRTSQLTNTLNFFKGELDVYSRCELSSNRIEAEKLGVK